MTDLPAIAASGPSLISPVRVGNLQLSHRVVHSAMTRLRNAPGTEAPRELNAEYYRQRATQGGLIVNEATHISPEGRGYVRAPGLYKPEQVDGWKLVTGAVHDKGGAIFCQLFHPGRVSHSSLLPAGVDTVAPSALGMSGQLYVDGGVKVPYSVPSALEASQIGSIVKDFARAAAVAVEQCGFDGVEIHGGNGYLIQQFMAAATNTRDDAYGGSLEKRMRFLLEVVDAVADAVGPQRVGVKIQPGATFSELVEPEGEVADQLQLLGPLLEQRKLAYVCCSSLNGDPYYKILGMSKPNISFDPFQRFREVYTGTLMVNGGITVEAGQQYVGDGTADLVAFGVPFLANANLPELIAAGWGSDKLNPGGFNTAVWYSKDPDADAVGYTDWPLVKP